MIIHLISFDAPYNHQSYTSIPQTGIAIVTTMSGQATSIGIDIGGTKILGVAESADGTSIAQTRTSTPHTAFAVDELIDSLTNLIEELSTEVVTADFARPDAIGIGIAGLVTLDGEFVRGPHLPEVRNLRLSDKLAERLSVPAEVVVDNDANVAAWAEFKRGAGMNKKSMVLATFGTGIGGGYVINGELFRGIRGYAGEIGHAVIRDNGHPCECGRRGCWEQYASGNALGRFGREACEPGSTSRILSLADGNVSAIRGQHVAQAAREKDATAISIINEYSHWVAEGLANISNILDVDCFVLGGGVVESKDVLIEPIKNAYNNIAYRRDAEVVVAELGESANAVGAADLARTLSSKK